MWFIEELTYFLPDLVLLLLPMELEPQAQQQAMQRRVEAFSFFSILLVRMSSPRRFTSP